MKYTSFPLPLFAVAALFFVSCHSCHNDHDHGHTEAGEGAAHAHSDGAHDESAGHGDEIVLDSAAARAAGVVMAIVTPRPFAEVIEVAGRIEPAAGSEQTLCAPMAGMVRFDAALTEGLAVKAGQSLLSIDAGSLADGNPPAAGQAELEAARQALSRAEKLRADRLITQTELDETRRRYEQARAAAASLGASTRRRSVAASMTGFVKSVLVEAGSYVSMGQPLAVVTQSRRLYLRAEVPLRQAAFLSRVSSATFRPATQAAGAAYDLAALGGRLVAKGTTAEGAVAGYVPVTFEFDNRGDIVPGTFAQVFLKGQMRDNVVAVPLSAVVEDQGLHFVFVTDHPGAYERREVQLGATDGQCVEVTAGLHSGERVAVAGAARLRMAEKAGLVPEGHSH